MGGMRSYARPLPLFRLDPLLFRYEVAMPTKSAINLGMLHMLSVGQ